jgi:hypothetical protein
VASRAALQRMFGEEAEINTPPRMVQRELGKSDTGLADVGKAFQEGQSVRAKRITEVLMEKHSRYHESGWGSNYFRNAVEALRGDCLKKIALIKYSAFTKKIAIT